MVFISVRSDFSLLNFYIPEFLFVERSINVRLVFFSKVVLCVCGMVLVAGSGSGVLY